MKSILTIVFVIVLGTFAQAKNTPTQTRVEAIAKTIVIKENAKLNTNQNNTLRIARLYRRSNSRVNKALSFSTKRNRAKMV